MFKILMDLNKNVICTNCYRTGMFVRGLRRRSRNSKLFNVYKETLISALNIEPECTIRDLKKLKYLPHATEKDILRVCQLLDKFNIQDITVSKIGKLMSQSIYDIEKKILLLNEFGSTKITTSALVNFNSYLRQSEEWFKNETQIPAHQCLWKNLNFQIGEILTKVIRNWSLSNHAVRTRYNKFFLHYVAYLLSLDVTEVTQMKEKYLNSYSIRHNSLKLMQEMVNLLQENFEFDKQMILENFWLMSHHPNHALAVVELLQTFDGLVINDIIQKIPKVLQCNISDLQNTLQYFKKIEITAEMIHKCPNIFYVPCATLQKRVNHLLSIPKSYVFRKHPRFLCLVSDYYIVMPRLKYLEKEGLSDTTIHALITYKDYYEALRRKKKLRFKNLKSFFISEFNQKADELLKELMKHRFCLYVPLVEQHKTLKYLKKKYGDEIIHKHIYAILYSRSNLQVAEEKLKSEGNYRSLKPEHFLIMCVYLLEQQFGFTGEAVLSSISIENLEIESC